MVSIFHPFIIHFQSSVAHSSHHLFVSSFLRVELNFIKEVVVLILAAQSLPLSQHSSSYLLRWLSLVLVFFSGFK